ncbi:MAG: tRNA-binding protein [Lewinellaceae bacterium]|nr:tRNA-binding protein [Lewinellaceae bacterium]
MISWEDFEKVDIRVGTIISAVPLENARNPAYVLHIDFGDIGILKSSAQITKLYSSDELIGKQILAVTNFPPKQIGVIQSQCLVLGFKTDDGVVLAIPEKHIHNGSKLC